MEAIVRHILTGKTHEKGKGSASVTINAATIPESPPASHAVGAILGGLPWLLSEILED